MQVNRVGQVGENGVFSGAQLLADYAYDAQSRRRSVARGNGTASNYGYSPASRLTSLNHDLGGTVNDANWAYTYTAAGQLETRTLVNVYEWTVPALNQAYTRNGLNQYTNVAGTSFSNDRRGNLTSDGSRTLAYDLENHLLSVTGTASGQLSYDPLGRLRSITANSVTTEFLYDGDRLVAEYDPSRAAGNQLLRRYVHGAGVDEPIVWYECPSPTPGACTSNRNWLIADRQGSIIATTDAAGAASIYRYGPYGEPEGGVWTGSRFRYTGQIALPELRLYHYKARVYDPYLGRFLQTDPVGYGDDLDLYAYVRNDPMGGTDPSGLASTSCGSRAGGDSSSCSTFGAPAAWDRAAPGNQSGSRARVIEIGGAEGTPRRPPGIGHNGPPVEEGEEATALCETNPAVCVMMAVLGFVLSGDTPQSHVPPGYGPVPGDQSPDAAANAYFNHMTQSDLAGARNELRGRPTIRGGRSYDHVQEVRDAQDIMMRRIRYARRQLSNPNLTSGQRAFYQDQLSFASRALDYSRGFVP